MDNVQPTVDSISFLSFTVFLAGENLLNAETRAFAHSFFQPMAFSSSLPLEKEVVGPASLALAAPMLTCSVHFLFKVPAKDFLSRIAKNRIYLNRVDDPLLCLWNPSSSTFLGTLVAVGSLRFWTSLPLAESRQRWSVCKVSGLLERTSSGLQGMKHHTISYPSWASISSHLWKLCPFGL